MRLCGSGFPAPTITGPRAQALSGKTRQRSTRPASFAHRFQQPPPVLSTDRTHCGGSALQVAIAHNEEKRILSCLWSLCENQHNYPVEILVINNHSTDHTEEVLKELGVTYFNEYQKGPGFARQCGLNHARGKYHLCIDADTLYPPQYISTMIKVLQDKEVAGAYALWSFLPNEHHLGLFF